MKLQIQTSIGLLDRLHYGWWILRTAYRTWIRLKISKKREKIIGMNWTKKYHFREYDAAIPDFASEQYYFHKTPYKDAIKNSAMEKNYD